MLKLSLFSLWARRRRLVGTGLAVVLGVAFLTGTLVLGDTLKANFDRLFTEVSAGTTSSCATATDHRASDEDSTNDRGVHRRVARPAPIRNVDGVATAEGQVVGYGSLLGRDGEPIGGNGPPRLAGSWIDDPQLNPYQLVAGRAPRAADEVVINRGAAKAGDLKLGDATTLQSPQPVAGEDRRHRDVRRRRRARARRRSPRSPSTARSSQITRRPGEVSTIVVRAEPGVSDAELRDRIRAVLPDRRRGDHRHAADRRDASTTSRATFLDLLRTFLVVFAGIALVVATLEHQQHVHDHRRAAHPRARAAAGGRRVAPPGAVVGRHRRPADRRQRPRRSARSAGSASPAC